MARLEAHAAATTEAVLSFDDLSEELATQFVRVARELGPLLHASSSLLKVYIHVCMYMYKFIYICIYICIYACICTKKNYISQKSVS